MKSFPGILLLSWTLGASTEFDRFFSALIWVESRGNSQARGDYGRSHGPAQIGRSYFLDALEVDPTLKWEMVYTVEGSQKIFRAYMKRWKVPETDFERMARVHNGGPKGHLKPATLRYWRKIQKEMP